MSYRLAPTIERESPFCDWPAVEYQALREFQSKARLVMDASRLPPTSGKHKLEWLALMQHYGVPTRLLDFTYSPYVALYFALRNRKKSDFAEIWAFDSIAIAAVAAKESRDVDVAIKERRGEVVRGRKASFAIEDFVSDLQSAQLEDGQMESAVEAALDPCGTRREHFNREGFVGIALPPFQNSRLSNQQGLFMFNGAEGYSFEISLDLMMSRRGQKWYKRFRIPAGILDEVEKQLFQLNIHDLSLFPDSEGLAGIVRQKIRLHW